MGQKVASAYDQAAAQLQELHDAYSPAMDGPSNGFGKRLFRQAVQDQLSGE